MTESRNLMAIDLESWVFPDEPRFQGMTAQERKKLDAGFVVESTRVVLDILRRHGCRLTFFVIAEMDEWYPDLVPSILAEGHEVGYHTHTHRYIERASILQEELARSREFLRKYRPLGFQAPAIIFQRDCYAVLRDHGFTYSSSVYDETRYARRLDGVLEIPVSVRRWRGGGGGEWAFPVSMRLGRLHRELPYGSSYFMALLGGRWMDAFITGAESRGETANLFIHNWQLVPTTEPRRSQWARLFKNPAYAPYLLQIRRTFEYLLSRHRFGRFDEYVTCAST